MVRQRVGSSAGQLGQFALERARQSAERGDFDDALEWLARAPKDDPTARALEAELRYRRAAGLIAEGEYGNAETQLNRIPRDGTVPQFLIDERLRLLRGHRAAMQDIRELRERFGSECDDCRGPDYFRIASCHHQDRPIPPVRKLPPGRHRPKIVGTYAASAYRSGWDRDRSDPLTQLVRGQKAEITPEVMRILGALLADYVAFHTPLPQVVDVVVPVPTSREREAARHGSLPLILGIAVRDRLALPLQEAVVQVGEHRDHTQAHGDERRLGLRGAWQAKVDRRLAGRTVLLVDDIVTSGTTAITAADMLREGGVGEVYAVALLHTESSR